MNWDTERDPLVLLNELFPLHSQGTPATQTRKCRLYLTACARRHWHRLPAVCRGLVEVAEFVADHARAGESLRARFAPVAEQLMHFTGWAGDLKRASVELLLALDAAPADLVQQIRAAHDPLDAPAPRPCGVDEWRALAALVYLPFVPRTPPFAWARPCLAADLVREIYYNPTLFPVFQSAWRTADVRAIARGMYDSREFGAMPILADALEDAGCDDADVLAHCRRPGEHVRGCRVLDRVLDPR